MRGMAVNRWALHMWNGINGKMARSPEWSVETFQWDPRKCRFTPVNWVAGWRRLDQIFGEPSVFASRGPSRALESRFV